MDPAREKEALLHEIEKLLAYGGSEPDINPALLEYLDREALRSIRDRLAERTSTLKEEDREWLAKFRKEE